MLIGILYLFLTFAVCFILIHIIKLAYIGFLSVRKKTERQPEPKTEQPQPKIEPVYYIVEKRRARKSVYSEPKEIKFKK